MFELNKNINFDFSDYTRKNDIHGTVIYPATMIAPMQNLLIEQITNNCDIKSAMDPFHGSGTTLYEIATIDQNIDIYGIDINPLANLITSVKLNGVSRNIDNNIKSITNTIMNSNELNYLRYFKNITKWFRYDIIESLTKLNYAISKIRNKQDRLYFWYCLINITRKYCNSRSSTYKLHTKKIENINNINNNVINDFLHSIECNKKYFLKNFENFKLLSGDALLCLDKFKKNSIDLIITSPPYGDNATTVTYGQYSILSLLWIDKKDLKLVNNELDNFSKIDRLSLGGTKINVSSNLTYYKETLDKISDNKKQKVINFMENYINTLIKLAEISNNYIVLTLGNRRVDNIIIDLTSITKNVLIEYGLNHVNTYSRNIKNKRMPRKISSKLIGDIQTINKEYILIMKK